MRVRVSARNGILFAPRNVLNFLRASGIEDGSKRINKKRLCDVSYASINIYR